jgi:hypothetical protein
VPPRQWLPSNFTGKIGSFTPPITVNWGVTIRGGIVHIRNAKASKRSNCAYNGDAKWFRLRTGS